MENNIVTGELLTYFELLPEESKEEIFSYFDYNEALLLRRVSRRFGRLAETHLTRRLNNRHVEICMDHTDPTQEYAITLSEFRKLRFSDDFILPKLAFVHVEEGDAIEIWEKFLLNPDLDWFMKNYAPHVKQLSLQSLQLPIENEIILKFIESFKSLEDFECTDLATIYPEYWGEYLLTTDKNFPYVFIPKSFRKLKRLGVYSVTCCEPESSPTPAQLDLFWRIAHQIGAFTSLEDFRHPSVNNYDYTVADLTVHLNTIIEIIKVGLRRKTQMKMFELGTICEAVSNHENLDFEVLLPFFEICSKAKVKIEDGEDLRFLPAFKDLYGDLIWSLDCMDPSSLQMYEFPQLRIVQLDNWKQYKVLIDESSEIKSPNLKGICLTLHAEQGDDGYIYDKNLVTLLFGRSSRPKMKSLAIKYRSPTGAPLEAFQISKTCSNLTYLCMRKCSAWNSFFLELWKGLPLLEHIKLCGCPSLGDIGLIGLNAENPSICQLKYLKALELTDLNVMTGITDETLMIAIRNMKLRYLRLSSDVSKRDEYDNFFVSQLERLGSIQYSAAPTAISAISLDGIRSLQTGVFGQSIQKMFFEGLALTGTSQEELDDVLKDFRSVHF